MIKMDYQKKRVYLSFSTDILHGGHIAIIRKAAKLGELTIGVLSDEAVSSYKHYPMLPFEERKLLFENIQGVSHVICQNTLSYKQIIEEFRPDIIVHGDDWRSGFQKPIRDELIQLLNTYGGELVEFPYSRDDKYEEIEKRFYQKLSIPDIRRGRLKKLLDIQPIVTVMEAHNGMTGLIAEKSIIYQNGGGHQFDAMWVSSLCDSTCKGKPDIELIDFSSRLNTIDEIMEVTTKPIILDGDTGGLIDHFVYYVQTLERIGVSAVIIEDKTGLKKNSLFGTEVEQTQDSIENFSEKIRAGKRAQKTKEFMIFARVESLILEKGLDDALTRAFAYVKAGADGIMIHSKSKTPDEIFEFVKRFRDVDSRTYLVVVPTSYNSVTEEEFQRHKINMVIYANHLIRSAYPAMKKTAESILSHHRSLEADEYCMSIKEILKLLPN